MIETVNRSLLLWSSKEKCLILKSEPIFILLIENRFVIKHESITDVQIKHVQHLVVLVFMRFSGVLLVVRRVA